ncbi:MAG: DUF4920 domain-containing protein [Rhodothermales bacterium]
MRKIYPLILLVALVLGACQSEQTADEAAVSDTMYDTYGEAITDEGAVPVQAVVAEREQYLGQAVKLEGTVAEVCQNKGCWLTLQTGDGNNVRVLVPKDEAGNYLFTVPTDISGRQVVVQGTLVEETLSEETQHHMAEDAGEDVEADAFQPKTELQLTAHGVLIVKVPDVQS